MSVRWSLCLCFLLVAVLPTGIKSCTQRYYTDDSFVCVCNEDVGCDMIGEIANPEDGQYLIVSTTRDDLRFSLSSGSTTSNDSTPVDVEIVIDADDLRQQIFGFGGAFTDSTGIAIDSLSENVQEMLLRGYFAPEGVEYNVGRIPIAGSDFSTRPYSYDDVPGDVDLVHFNLTSEDYLYKIPFIHKAMQMSQRNLLLFGSPWSPPSWMKTNGMFNGTGRLLDEMREPWARYFIKFLDAYENEGISLWGLTAQNEPTMGLITDYAWNACGFTAEAQRDFVKDFLGPVLNESGYLENIKLMVTDDSREVFPTYPTTVLSDEIANSYVDGIAVHWYGDRFTPAAVLNTVHNRFPDKFLMYTEACEGFIASDDNRVRLGSWSRGQEYATNIIENINHWSSGWTDWNMALDEIGGPNWAVNYVDSPIIVNKTANEFYKQPMFYSMGHFSKFVPEGSFALGFELIESSSQNIDATVFSTPSDQIVTVLVNRNEESKSIRIENGLTQIVLEALPKSVNTIVLSNNS